jgi:ABC-type branched-subunit amino acid transport system ATPase component
VMNLGRIVHEGTSQTLLNDPIIQATYLGEK